jgi:RNA exonuclease 4
MGPKANSNWNKLKNKLGNSDAADNFQSGETHVRKKAKRTDINALVDLKQKNTSSSSSSAAKAQNEEYAEELKSKYVGLDCEMVGTGPSGKRSVLARCCLVDFDGNKVYDEFVQPKGFVTDFRTKYSGIRSKDINKRVAIDLQQCIKDVAKLLEGKLLVGHALKNDLDVLHLSHHRSSIRDTATYRPYMRPHGAKFRPRALKDLSREFLGVEIQTGEHDPGVDASTAMALYRRCRKEWELSLKERRALAKQKSKDAVAGKIPIRSRKSNKERK